jgi:hypothetical protein
MSELNAVSRNTRASYTFDDGRRYYGPIWNSVPHGQGIELWPSGQLCYRGQFEKGKRHGYGVYLGLDGRRYEGGFKNGSAHGHGISTWPDESVYHGEWKEGQRHGKGVFTCSVTNMDLERILGQTAKHIKGPLKRARCTALES